MLKLILADNQAIFRAGIAKVLAVEDEMRIVAQAQYAVAKAQVESNLVNVSA